MVLDEQKAEVLESLLREHVDADIVARLAERLGLSAEDAMDRYYRSRLAASIADGACGMQYLAVDYLVDDLLLNEPELFADVVVERPAASARNEDAGSSWSPVES